MTMLDKALACAAKGVPVFPCQPTNKMPCMSKRAGGHGFKDATTDEGKIRQWWKRWPDAMIGMPTGTLTGIAIFDVDVKDNVNGYAAMLAAKLPQNTPQVATPSGGLHLYYRAPDDVKIKSASGGALEKEFGPGLDTRGEAGYVILPPSINSAGKAYKWNNDFKIDDALPVPQHLLPYVAKRGASKPNGHSHGSAPLAASIAAAVKAIAAASSGHRHGELNKQAFVIGIAIAAGKVDEAEARTALIEAGLAAIGAGRAAEVERTVEEAMAAGKMAPVATPSKKATAASIEDATALEFAQTHAEAYRYVAKWSRWLKWHGNRWCFEDTLHAFDESRKLCRSAGDARAKTVAAVERLARSDRALAATDDQWDRDPDLLNAATVTIDLCNGMTRPPARTDFITKMAAVDPAPPSASHPLWSTFLMRVTGDDPELIGFLQRYLGYCLTAHTHEHVMAFLYGTGANGKGVFINTVSHIFGDYGLVAPMEMFLASKQDRHPTEIARLHGARLVTVQETQKGRAWDEAKIKALTSEDKLTGHFMRQDFFDFHPTHKLMFSSNHKPTLRTTDEAMRRRFLLVPFTQTIPPHERDPQLPEKLRAEWPAILGWMIDGCLAWRGNGLMVPAIVRDATDQYLADQDSLSEWLDQWIERKDRNFVTSTELFRHWKAWCEQRNQPPGSERAFVADLEDKGYRRERHTNGRGFKGIALKAAPEPELWERQP